MKNKKKVLFAFVILIISSLAIDLKAQEVKADQGFFQLEKLDYNYSDLEPHIDARTMEIHYSKHYLGYTNKLNKALVDAKITPSSIEQLIKTLDVSNTTLRNNAGGYYNHNLFWKNISPKGGGEPVGILAEAIIKEFGSFSNLKKQLSEAGAKQFGSGWAWLVVTKEGKLAVTSTPNQDNPLMLNAVISGTPILALDVWEHAYYLNYQNKRDAYIEAFFKIINWEVVLERYMTTIKK